MKKILAVSIYIIFHIFFLREVRNVAFSLQVNEGLLQQVQQSENVSVSNLDIRLVNFEYKSGELTKILHYKISFGSFFLISIVFLILLGAHKSFFWAITGIHMLDLIISSLVLNTSPFFGFKTLVITDLTSRYLIPLCSIGIIPVAFINNRKLSDARDS